MNSKSRWLAFALAALMVFTALGCGDDNDDDYVAQPAPRPTVISGKAAQGYVTGAMVLADRLTPAGVTGDYEKNDGEVSATTDAAGNFTLTIPPAYGAYVLFVSGGTVSDSQGNALSAFPMLAPMGARNITPVTTLVVFDGDLKARIGAAYDADIASPAGSDAQVLKLAKAVEAVLDLLTRKPPAAVHGIGNQMRIYAKLAGIFAKPGTVLNNTESLLEAIYMAGAAIMLDDAIVKNEAVLSGDAFGIANILARAAGGILMNFPQGDVVVESNIQPIYDATLAAVGPMLAGTAFAFDPNASVVPFPNDVAWARTGGMVTLPVSGTDQTAAFYTAINALNLKGLSPNLPIAIPLAANVALDPIGLKNNIRLINLNMLMGALYQGLNLGDPRTTPPEQIPPAVMAALAQFPESNWPLLQESLKAHYNLFYDARVEVGQDGAFIKIYPIQPLAPGATYLVYVMAENPDTLDLFVDKNGVMVKRPALYNALLGSQELTGDLAGLEPLRQSYVPLANLVLRTVSVEADNLLHMFTFTTASKTLSTDDFKKIMAYAAGMGITSLDELAAVIGESPNLPYTANGELAIAAEYNAIKTQIPPMTAVDMPAPGVFITVNLQSPTLEQIGVPYTVYNPETYDGTVVIFQHGLGQSKATGELVAPMFDDPVLAMDFPYHGARAMEGAASGEGFISGNLPVSRMNCYQAYFDMNVMLRNLNAGLFDLDGDGTVNMPGQAVVDEDDVPTRVQFMSHSLGSILGSVFAADNIADLDKVAMSAGGGNFAAIFDQATHPMVASITDVLGVERNSIEYFTAFGVLQTIMDPADPAYLAAAAKSASEKILHLSAFGDTLVPNVANHVLALTIGHDTLRPVVDFTDPVPAQAGWYLYGGKQGMEKNWMAHTFVIHDSIEGYPVAGPHMDADYVSAASQAARAQISAFFNP